MEPDIALLQHFDRSSVLRSPVLEIVTVTSDSSPARIIEICLVFGNIVNKAGCLDHLAAVVGIFLPGNFSFEIDVVEIQVV